MLEFDKETNKVLAIQRMYVLESIRQNTTPITRDFFFNSHYYKKRVQFTGEITEAEFDSIVHKLFRTGFLAYHQEPDGTKVYYSEFIQIAGISRDEIQTLYDRHKSVLNRD